MISYNWSIVSKLDVKTNIGSFKDVVHRVHWICDAVNENGTRSTARGRINLPEPSGEFIAFSDLTEAKILDWVQEKIGNEKMAEIQQTLTANIDKKENPEIVRKRAPWVED